MSDKLCLHALSIAFQDAGQGDPSKAVKEVPRFSNRGRRVEQYQDAAGTGRDEPYCDAAVFTWFQEAAHKFGVKNPLTRSGYCPATASYLKENGLVREHNTDAQPGDVILFWIPKKRRFGHAGIILKNLGDGKVKTVEANTIGEGMSVNGHQNEGDGVYVKTRVLAGTRHLVGNMQRFLVAAPATVSQTQMMLQSHISEGHAAIKAASLHPIATEEFVVMVDGVLHHEVRSFLIEGSTVVGIKGLISALAGRSPRRVTLSPDKTTVNIYTT